MGQLDWQVVLVRVAVVLFAAATVASAVYFDSFLWSPSSSLYVNNVVGRLWLSAAFFSLINFLPAVWVWGAWEDA